MSARQCPICHHYLHCMACGSAVDEPMDAQKDARIAGLEVESSDYLNMVRLLEKDLRQAEATIERLTK